MNACATPVINKFSLLILFALLLIMPAQAYAGKPDAVPSAIQAHAVQVDDENTARIDATVSGGGNRKAQVNASVDTGTNKPPFKVAGKLSRELQKITGLNFIAESISGIIAKRVLEHKLGGKAKIKIKTYSFTDLLAGKIESISVSLKHGHAKNIQVSDITIAPTTPIWIDTKGRHGKRDSLKTPVTMSISASLTDADVCRALASETVTSSLRGLKLDLPGLGGQILQIIQPKVNLLRDSIIIDASLIAKDAKPDTAVKINICAKPVLVGSKIILQDLKIDSPDLDNTDVLAQFVKTLFDPLIDFAKFDRTDRAFRLTNLSFTTDKVLLTGKLLLVPQNMANQIAHAGTK